MRTLSLVLLLLLVGCHLHLAACEAIYSTPVYRPKLPYEPWFIFEIYGEMDLYSVDGQPFANSTPQTESLDFFEGFWEGNCLGRPFDAKKYDPTLHEPWNYEQFSVQVNNIDDSPFFICGHTKTRPESTNTTNPEPPFIDSEPAFVGFSQVVEQTIYNYLTNGVNHTVVYQPDIYKLIGNGVYYPTCPAMRHFSTNATEINERLERIRRDFGYFPTSWCEPLNTPGDCACCCSCVDLIDPMPRESDHIVSGTTDLSVYYVEPNRDICDVSAAPDSSEPSYAEQLRIVVESLDRLKPALERLFAAACMQGACVDYESLRQSSVLKSDLELAASWWPLRFSEDECFYIQCTPTRDSDLTERDRS